MIDKSYLLGLVTSWAESGVFGDIERIVSERSNPKTVS